MSKSLFDDIFKAIDDRIAAYLKRYRIDLRKTTGALPVSQVPSGIPGTRLADGSVTPTQLSFDPATQAELDAHAADTTSVHGIADTSTLYRAGGTDVALADGGTGASLSDPNADRLMFWDDSGSHVDWLTVGSGLSITGTTISASGGGGGLSDGDYGDVTVGGSGTTITIDNDAVTYAKMQNVSAASKLIGRGDSGSGDPQEISLGSGLSMTGTTLSASGGGGSGLLEQIIDQLAAGTDPIDFKITSGDYIVLGFFTRSTTSGWLDATNAVHTVTTGKTLKTLLSMGNNGIVADNSSRKARFRNTTDGADILADNVLLWPLIAHFLDVGGAGVFPTAAAGKTVKVGVWNTDATGRAMGALVVCKEV